MLACTHVHGVCVGVGGCVGGGKCLVDKFSFYFQGLASTSFMPLFLLHLSACLLFNYLVPTFHYFFTKGEKVKQKY